MDHTMQIPMITAHSGCENTARDSMDSISSALRYTPDTVEMDVRLAGDGVLRISHDALSLPDYANKLTLEQVFLRVSGTGLRLNCDLKNASALYGVLQMAERFGFCADRLILSGCLSPEQLVRDASILERANVFLNIEEIFKFFYLAERKVAGAAEFSELMNTPWSFLRRMQAPRAWFEKAARFVWAQKASAVNLPYRYLTDETAAIFSEAGVPISVWTVNDPEAIVYCLQKNVSNITTLNVAAACEKRKAAFDR